MSRICGCPKAGTGSKCSPLGPGLLLSVLLRLLQHTRHAGLSLYWKILAYALPALLHYYYTANSQALRSTTKVVQRTLALETLEKA